MGNPSKLQYIPRTVENWRQEYDAQVERDRKIVERHMRRRERAAVRVNRPAWAFTLIALAFAGACYLAKAMNWVSTPKW